MSSAPSSVRSELLKLGIGDFNATLIIPMMFMGPAQCYPDLTQMKLLIKALQKQFQAMGATWIVAHGRLDQNTATCIAALVGPRWSEIAWHDIVTALEAAKASGKSFARPSPATGVELSGMGDLPDVVYAPGDALMNLVGLRIEDRSDTTMRAGATA